MEKTKRLKFNWSMAQFQRNANKFIAKLLDSSDQLVVKMATDFVGSAVTHTPPSLGKRNIQKKYWSRPILVLSKLINNEYDKFRPIAIDFHQFKAGMKYKVVNTQKKFRNARNSTPYAYTKSLAQAKKAAFIETRGLARVMWGKNLPNIHSKVPTSIQNIFNKAPKLMGLDYNKIEKQRTENETCVQIKNSANSVTYDTLVNAMRFADKKVQNTMQRELKNMLNKRQDI